MLVRPEECRPCELDALAEGYSEPDGLGTYRVGLAGESLGQQEAKDGLPFRQYAPAGSILMRALRRAGLEREGFFLFNAIQCRPPRNYLEGAPYEASAIAHCKVHRDRIVDQYRPKGLVALGNIPLKTLTNYGVGKKRTISFLRGYPVPSKDYPDVWVLPTFHPSFLLPRRDAKGGAGGMKLLGALIYDLKRAVEFAEHGLPQKQPTRFLQDPTREEFLAFQRDYDPTKHILSYDIETPQSSKLDEEEIEKKGDTFNIIRISFCFDAERGYAVSVPWQEPYISIAKMMLASKGPKRTWNGSTFDDPRLEAAGAVINGRRYDMMWCLAGRTRVPLWDGSVKTIREVVDKRLPITLVGMDAFNRRIPVKVIDWHKNKVKGQKWLAIKVDGSRYPMYCTPEHKVWTSFGWRRADEIRIGDRVPLPKLGSDAVIHGTILGDGHVDRGGILQLYHSTKQRGWFMAKARHLGMNPRERDGSKGREIYSGTTIGRHWRRRFYVKGEKHFFSPPNFAALAVWYGDDGNWHRNAGQKGTGRARLCVGNMKGQDELLQWARDNFKGHIVFHGPENNRVLCFGRGAAAEFFDAIAPYLHPTMSYKLPPKWREQYNGWMETQVPRWSTVVDVGPPSRSSVKSNESRYCVTVDHPTHRFFTLGGLVSNCWHFLQPTLPRSLGFVAPFYNWTLGPWKHEGDANPAYYSCCDSLALQQIGDGVERDLRKMNLWERYEEHVVSTHDVLKLMAKNGLPYSKERAATFKVELETKRDERLEKLQELVPMELRSLHPKKGYKKVPKEVEEALHMYEDEDGIATLDTRENWMLKTTGMKLIEVEDIVAGPCGCALEIVDEGMFPAPDCPICKGKGVTKTNLITSKVSRWAKVKPFLPTSVQQVLRYCKHMKYKLPRNYKTQNETTGEDALKKIQSVLRNKGKADPVLIHTIECRQLSKVLGTYVNAWKPGADGRIHSTPGFWGSMFRISWRNPNISGTIADKKKDYIAAGFRRCVEAPEGYLLLERDWSGIEAVLVGWFAGDENYMRLARLGVHSFLASHILNKPADLTLPDDELRREFKLIKRTEPRVYDDAKHCTHGINFGLTPRLMAELYEMALTKAKKLHNLYFSLFPKIREWQIATLQKAHKEARLVNPYRYCMWFWDVYKWDARYSTWRLGDGAKSAISFLPRDTAAGMLKEVLLRLERDHKLASRGIMLSSTHDAVLTQVREDQVDEVDEILKFEMEKPVEELGGLVIGSEAKVGKCWDEEEMTIRS